MIICNLLFFLRCHTKCKTTLTTTQTSCPRVAKDFWKTSIALSSNQTININIIINKVATSSHSFLLQVFMHRLSFTSKWYTGPESRRIIQPTQSRGIKTSVLFALRGCAERLWLYFPPSLSFSSALFDHFFSVSVNLKKKLHDQPREKRGECSPPWPHRTPRPSSSFFFKIFF